MKKLILMVAVFSLILTSCERKEKDDLKRVNFEDYKEYAKIRNYPALEPLMIIWWRDVKNPPPNVKLEYPFKKFCITSELRTIMKELDELSHNKKTPSMIPVPGERNILRIYFSSKDQKQFRILEIEFALDPNSHEFATSYGRSAKLYELLSSKEESKNFWSSPGEGRVDSNEYKEHMRKMREFVMSQRDPNLTKPKQ